MSDFFVGIDGGGTSCRAAVADRNGRVLGRAKGGAANILTDLEGALANIIATSKEALKDAGLDLSLGDVPAFLGLAGANIEASVASLLSRLPFRRARIDTDGLIALQGAFGDADGVAVILGTGSVYITRKGGVVTYTGGWGFVLGDLGGGAQLGHALLQECLLVHDGIRHGSPLIDMVMNEFSHDPARIVAFAHGAKPGDFGRFAPAIFDAAAKGDTVATMLVRNAAAAIDEALDAASSGSNCGICLLGGLAPLYPQWLAEPHRRRLVTPRDDALSGAVALAITTFRTEER